MQQLLLWLSFIFVLCIPADAAYQIPNQAVTLYKLAARTKSGTVGVGGIAVSASSGINNITGVSFTPVTNLSVTITTIGRPVFVGLMSDGGSSNASAVGVQGPSGGTGAAAQFKFFRGATAVSFTWVELNGAASNLASAIPCSAEYHIDFPSAGTYTYTFQAAQGGGGTTTVNNCVLVAYEM